MNDIPQQESALLSAAMAIVPVLSNKNLFMLGRRVRAERALRFPAATETTEQVAARVWRYLCRNSHEVVSAVQLTVGLAQAPTHSDPGRRRVKVRINDAANALWWLSEQGKVYSLDGGKTWRVNREMCDHS